MVLYKLPILTTNHANSGPTSCWASVETDPMRRREICAEVGLHPQPVVGVIILDGARSEVDGARRGGRGVGLGAAAAAGEKGG